jgi:hypothetical protein
VYDSSLALHDLLHFFVLSPALITNQDSVTKQKKQITTVNKGSPLPLFLASAYIGQKQPNYLDQYNVDNFEDFPPM